MSRRFARPRTAPFCKTRADLNSLISPGASLQLTYAVGINDAGEIVGFGVPTGVPPEDYETQGHAYILTPCDENHPDVEGCDYSLMDADAAARENPVPGIQKPPTTAPHTVHPFRLTWLEQQTFWNTNRHVADFGEPHSGSGG
jgi:hypothetical protein